MEDYLRSLQKQLKSFPADEQAALLEEVRSHMESGEDDSQQAKDKLMKEMGSPNDMGKGFRELYRPNRLFDYLLVAIPYVLSLYLTAFYMSLRPQYPWVDIRLNVIFDLALIAIGLWRRSVLATLFWLNMAILQLSFIVLQGVWQPYWYYGSQTILWAILLAALLGLFGQTVWKNRRDALIVVYALLPLGMEMLGTAVWSIQPVSYISNPVDRSLLVIFLRMQGGNVQLYATLATMALFFLASNRDIRWVALVASAMFIGFGREYLVDRQNGNVAMVAQWVYYLYILIPVAVVKGAWLLEWSKRRRLKAEAEGLA